ncbi:hypothetical protein COO01_31675, partial [Bacillus toyonensis]
SARPGPGRADRRRLGRLRATDHRQRERGVHRRAGPRRAGAAVRDALPVPGAVLPDGDARDPRRHRAGVAP